MSHSHHLQIGEHNIPFNLNNKSTKKNVEKKKNYIYTVNKIVILIYELNICEMIN